MGTYSRTGIWSIVGDGWRTERRFFGIWFYTRITKQKWSPLMTEVSRERGIRIGHRRFGMVETVKQFHDGQEPKVVHGEY